MVAESEKPGQKYHVSSIAGKKGIGKIMIGVITLIALLFIIWLLRKLWQSNRQLDDEIRKEFLHWLLSQQEENKRRLK